MRSTSSFFVIGLSLVICAEAGVIKIWIAESCRTYVPMIAPAIDSALLRARLGQQKLLELQEQKLQNSNLTPEMVQIDLAVEWLLTARGMEDAAGRFDRIGRFEFDGVSTGLWGDAEKGKVGDVIIYCGFKRFKFNEKMQLWHDTVNNIKIIKELYEELIAVNTGHLATVSQNAGPPNVAVSSVTLLAGGLDLWWNHYLGRKQTSWNAGREVDRLHANWIAEFMTRSQSTKPWIDTFGDMLDATLLHEFSHVVEAGSSEDTEELNSYGWDNALDIRRSDNAENLMFFATATKLVTLGYELREDGSWDNLHQDPNSARPACGRSML
ncbi:hypothetical protein EG327_005668 [Venturia inaequalis]|uniref:Lysine-specific metallo-endopeptidase domain-containing protein n=1 Tax=Venturia inaequalis TaxID=5025 RepID=A0A8H3V8E1_VENIN|nr:hypothetical protein EG327_005668 [Venturia inaequalis]